MSPVFLISTARPPLAIWTAATARLFRSRHEVKLRDYGFRSPAGRRPAGDQPEIDVRLFTACLRNPLSGSERLHDGAPWTLGAKLDRTRKPGEGVDGRGQPPSHGKSQHVAGRGVRLDHELCIVIVRIAPTADFYVQFAMSEGPFVRPREEDEHQIRIEVGDV